MKTLLASAAIGLALITGASAASECKVGLEQYQNVKAGMVFTDIIKAAGCWGEEMSEAELAKGTTMTMVHWDGKALGGYMLLTLVNNKVAAKAQFGLK
jgi:hypothetical protein